MTGYGSANGQETETQDGGNRSPDDKPACLIAPAEHLTRRDERRREAAEHSRAPRRREEAVPAARRD